MNTALAAVAITMAWLVSAVGLFFLGAQHERTVRYDGCRIAVVGNVLAYVCPIAHFRERPPRPPTTDNA